MNIYLYLHELKNMSTNTKYANWYYSLIDKAARRFNINDKVQITQNTRLAKKQLGYVEGNHIIPRSLRPEFSNHHFNIVYLTAKEHFIAHLLLTKMFTGNEKTKMIFAFRRMHHSNNGNRYTSKQFDILRLKMPAANLGKMHITDGINTRYHLKSEPVPSGWVKGTGLRYKNSRQESNRKLHNKTYEVYDIASGRRFLVKNLKEWSVTVNIPYSTLSSAARASSIVRNMFVIKETG